MCDHLQNLISLHMDGPRLDYRHRILPKSAEYLNVTYSTRFITLPYIPQPKCFILGFYIYLDLMK